MIRTFNCLILLFTLTFQGDSQSFNEVDISDAIDSIRLAKQIPGLFASVVSRDSIFMALGFGIADSGSERKVSPNHAFKIGSITKTFTALAIMKLVEEGLIQLDDVLMDIAPEIPYKNRWSDDYPLKIVHLLGHKTGFDDMHFSLISSERTADMDAYDEVISCMSSLEARWQPGLVHSYSNPNYTILGYLIEKLTHMPYQDYIAEHVLDPLGMKNTFFISQRITRGKDVLISDGYQKHNGKIESALDKRLVGESAGAIYSTAQDMALFTQFFLNDSLQNTIFHNGNRVIGEMKKLHGDFEIRNQITEGYGLGLYSFFYGANDLHFYGHTGGIHGFSSIFLFSAKENLGFVVSNNLGVGNRSLMNFLVDHYRKDSRAIENANARDSSFEAVDIEAWEGTYIAVNSRNSIANIFNSLLQSISVKAKKDSLVITPFLSEEDTYYPISNNRFKSVQDASDQVYLTEFNGQKSVYFYEDLMMPISVTILWSKRIVMIVSIVMGALSILSGITLFIVGIFRRRFYRIGRRWVIFSLPHLCFASMLGVFIMNMNLAGVERMGSLGLTSLLIFFFSIGLLFFSVFGCYHLYSIWNGIKSTFFKFCYVGLVLTGWALVMYSWHFDWLFMRTWAY